MDGRKSLGQSSIAALLLLELSDRLNSMLIGVSRLVKASLRRLRLNDSSCPGSSCHPICTLRTLS